MTRGEDLCSIVSGNQRCRVTSCLQEERAVFDIHDYGDRIVAALNGVGQRRSFSSIVAGLDNFEACKYLLASLQLVTKTLKHSPASNHIS